MKTLLNFFVILSALTFMVSCGDLSVKRINHIGLYDFSASVPNKVFRNYVNVFTKDIYTNLSLDDVTVNFPIDESSENQATKIFYDDFTGKNFLGKDNIVTHADDTINARFLRFKIAKCDSICNEFVQSKNTRSANCQNTDIIRSLLIASQYMVRDTASTSNMEKAKDLTTGDKEYETTNFLVINSDMLNDEPGKSLFDFAGYGSLTRDEILHRIEILQQNKMIANLKGCFIIVNGATSSGKDANKLYENIQLFWTEYFKKSGATLLAYGFDSSFQIEKFFKDFKR